MEVWLRMSDSVANGLIGVLLLAGVTVLFALYARTQGMPLFPRRRGSKP